MSLKPVITEKSLSKTESNQYTFIVDIALSKSGIAKLVEETFSVHVEKVRTAIIHGKTKKAGTKRRASKKSDVKKAVVEIAKGEKIEVFETEEKKKKGKAKK